MIVSSPEPSPSAEVFRPLPCIAEGILAVEACSARTFPRHTHDQFGIGLILSGAQASASGRGEVESGPGALITVNPGEVHDGRPIGGARAWRMLYLDPAVIAAAQADPGSDRRIEAEFSTPVLDRPGVPALFRQFYQAATGYTGDTGRMAFDALLPAIVALLSDQVGRDPTPPTSVARARDYLHDRQGERVTLAELAAEVGLSPFHLSRRFAAEFGLPPHAYLLQLRVTSARRMIAAGTAIASAATEAGFADQSHLTRIFTRQFGYSPAAYARTQIRPPQRKNVQDRHRQAP